MTKLNEIANALEIFAPLPLQDGFDNAGLQIGLTEAEVTGVLLCLDVTEDIIKEAVALGCNLIVSHHPLIFRPLKSITGVNLVERCVLMAIKHDIAIYSAHTNLDNAYQGVNYRIAQKFSLTDIKILSPKNEILLKLVTYVPEKEFDLVQKALFDAGCGKIGKYENCSFYTTGKGTFKGTKGTDPFCGNVDVEHTENEVRIETILPSYKKQAVLKAMLNAHPYEEPAYDFFAMENEWQMVGSGIIGQLPEYVDELQLLSKIKDTFGAKGIRYSSLLGRKIRKIAICGGAGGFLAQKAAAQGAEMFITGEVGYHDMFGWENRMVIAAMGHYESEQFTIDILKEIIELKFPNLKLINTTKNTNPIHYL